jgi:hypothetical protein
MATLKQTYVADAAFTVTNLQSLATSASRVAGWTSAAVDNTTTRALDYLVSGQFTVNTGVAPTTLKSISVYAYAAFDDAPTWPDLFSAGTEGTEGTATVHDEEQRDCGMILLWSCTNDAGTSEVYAMPPKSIAQAFGGFVPNRFALFVTQDTGQALHSAGNALYYAPMQIESV